MVSLPDLAPLTRSVDIRGSSLSVTGLTARGIVILLDRFPEIRKMFGGRGKSMQDISVDELINSAPGALAAIIATGLGDPGSDNTEKWVEDHLTVGEQAEVIATMLEITFPKGLGHFSRILDTLGVTEGSAGTGKGQATKLPPQFSSAFGTDTHPEKSGTTLPDNSQDGEKSSSEEASKKKQIN